VVVIERDPGSLVPWFPGPAPWTPKKKTSPEQAAASTRLPRRRPTPANNLLPRLSLLQPATKADNETPCALVSALRSTPPWRHRSEPRAGGALVPEEGRRHRGAEPAGALPPTRPTPEQPWAPGSLDLWLPGPLVSWLLQPLRLWAPGVQRSRATGRPRPWARERLGARAPRFRSPPKSAPASWAPVGDSLDPVAGEGRGRRQKNIRFTFAQARMRWRCRLTQPLPPRRRCPARQTHDSTPPAPTGSAPGAQAWAT